MNNERKKRYYFSNIKNFKKCSGSLLFIFESFDALRLHILNDKLGPRNFKV